MAGLTMKFLPRTEPRDLVLAVWFGAIVGFAGMTTIAYLNQSEKSLRFAQCVVETFDRAHRPVEEIEAFCKIREKYRKDVLEKAGLD